MIRIALAGMISLAVAVAGCKSAHDKSSDDKSSDESSLPLQQKADATEWSWIVDGDNLLHCVARELKGYEVRVIRRENTQDIVEEPFIVQIFDNDEEVHSFRAHSNTVFTQIGDVIFVAKFSPFATGCTVVAHDLKRRKQLWECKLRGNPPPGHSKYHNRVIILSSGGAVIVYGKESNGRYIEYVDAETGKTVGHKKLPPEEPR
jgi:hypothetical protein